MKVAIQGEIGSFHHAVALEHFGNNIKPIACESFKSVFESLKNKECKTAVVAIENSLFGSINEVYDLLLKYRFPIVAEVPLRVHQSLVGLKNSKLSSISHVYSHPVALAQCSDFLDQYLPKADRIENYDTAASAKLIANLKDSSKAAIASELTADLYNLEILKKGIENHNANYTRFLIINSNGLKNLNYNKVSLILETNHQAGSLYKALGIFAELNVNLTKLQSRPIVGKVWKYRFYIDALANKNQLKNIVGNLKSQGCNVDILGCYISNT